MSRQASKPNSRVDSIRIDILRDLELDIRKTNDVVIIGGGVIGSSCAYHLQRSDPKLSITVVEKDPTYQRASSALSAGNARIQFDLEENIQISKYTFEVLASFGEDMKVDGIAPDVGFRAEGNLFVVDERSRHPAKVAVQKQKRMGCNVEWLDTAEAESRWPLLNLGSFSGATFGGSDGYLDGYSFLMAYRNKADSLGVDFIEDEVVSLERVDRRVSGVRLASGKILAAGSVICCAGAWASQILRTAGVAIPVDPVQRQAFLVDTEVKPRPLLPLINFPSGLYLRSEGDDRILVGRSMDDDPVGVGFSWSESRFNDVLWPELAEVVPAFDRLRIANGWAGLYAVNRVDGNAILGQWPELEGLFLANGFSGHGLQQAPAVGRYLSEQVLGIEPKLDLSAFGPGRLLEGRTLNERSFI
jgi:glycine/D-amino acid oxidase-like deaminating enzyme